MDEAQHAFDKKDYAKAFSLWRPLADQGDAGAQAALGIMYREGEGVSKDYEAALKWFRSSANQGNPDGEFLLGMMYVEGQGVPQDINEASKWLKQAAAQKFEAAQDALDIMSGKLSYGSSAKSCNLSMVKYYNMETNMRYENRSQSSWMLWRGNLFFI
jgi:uncharacterized protein